MTDTLKQARPSAGIRHAHLFGPYDRFPLAAERSYTPPEAVEAQYLALLARLGLSNGVLVHPSAYGEDHSLLLHALAAQPSLRGVVVVQPGSRLALAGLRERGVRAARFSHRSGAGANFAGSASFDDLRVLAPVLAARRACMPSCGPTASALPGIASANSRALPVPVVIDHMGGFDVAAGIGAPGFRTLRDLLASGKRVGQAVRVPQPAGHASRLGGRPARFSGRWSRPTPSACCGAATGRTCA